MSGTDTKSRIHVRINLWLSSHPFAPYDPASAPAAFRLAAGKERSVLDWRGADRVEKQPFGRVLRPLRDLGAKLMTDRKQFMVDAQTVILEVLDTAGIDQYLALHDLFMRESDGFVLVFS